MTKLTTIQILNTKPEDKPYRLSDEHSLYFYVTKSDKRTWRYRFKIDGNESNFTLGKYPAMSLERTRAT